MISNPKRPFVIEYRRSSNLYVVIFIFERKLFFYIKLFFQYYEMSYGLNVEMHKQVSPFKYLLLPVYRFYIFKSSIQGVDKPIRIP